MTTEQPHDSHDDSQAVGPGRLLRNAREQLGWTREQVASRIHLRLTLIAEIESDKYDKHTSHIFIRGYLRAYAKLVGVPEEAILAAYDRLGLTPPPDNIDMQSFSRRSRQRANDSRLKLMTWLLVLILIGLSVAWWWQSSSRRSAGDEALAATEMSTSDNVPSTDAAPATEVIEPAIDVTPDVTATTAEPVVSSAAATAPAVDASVAATADASATEVAAPPSTEVATTEPVTVPQLKIDFTADCWLEVKDANGKTLFSGLKKANDMLVLEGAEPLKFTIGAPMAINLEYRGKPFDMSRFNTGRIARFSLPQE